jgi:hypothetical protein
MDCGRENPFCLIRVLAMREEAGHNGSVPAASLSKPSLCQPQRR